MTWRPGKKPGALHYAGDPETSGGFRTYLVEFIDWMGAMHFSQYTIKNRRIELGYFIDWCEERSIMRPDEVTRALLERYRQHVFHYRRKDNGTPLSFQTQTKRLISVRMFFQWMARQYHLLFNPASELELPRTEQRLPRHVLNVAEVEQIINATDIDEPSGLGVRDRAMLESLYGADIRYIQALLGHADLSTTEIYTRVSILKLKEVHAQTHPARLTRTGEALLDTLSELIEDDA